MQPCFVGIKQQMLLYADNSGREIKKKDCEDKIEHLRNKPKVLKYENAILVADIEILH